MKELKSEQDLIDAIEKDGIVTVPAGTIRDIFKHTRLKVNVRFAISDTLDKIGFSHYPVDFPDDQYAFVRIVPTGSGIDKIIQSALNPSPKTDKPLAEAASAGARLAVLKEVGWPKA
jgi:hypothetical protein